MWQGKNGNEKPGSSRHGFLMVRSRHPLMFSTGIPSLFFYSILDLTLINIMCFAYKQTKPLLIIEFMFQGKAMGQWVAHFTLDQVIRVLLHACASL